MRGMELGNQAFPLFFRGKLSDETIDADTLQKPRVQPTTALEAAVNNWHLAIVAVASFFVAFDVINLDDAWLNVKIGPRYARGFTRIVAWCRGNPNTVTSSAAIVGICALIVYGLRIVRAAKSNRSTRTR